MTVTSLLNVMLLWAV